MENLVLIDKISINETGILTIKPQDFCFNMIYRSAMGVHWDDKEKYLFFVTPVEQRNDIINAFKKIILAVKTEYGKILTTYQNTSYESIDKNLIKELLD